tara:strand:- start:3701 stop:4249 length:549 start_codon:yes stop_codon:yes gene_type:complete
MLKNLDFSSFNYLEIDILKNNDETNDKNIINVNWSKTDFSNFLSKLINSNNFKKPFEKQYRVLKYLDLICVKNISDNKYNLHSLSLVDKEIEDNLLCIKYKKNNLAIFQFPSTDKINDDFYLNKITFKITNLIYLNFEVMKKNDIEIFYRVYINFNNDKTNIDHNLIIKNLEDTTIKILDLF